MMRFGPTVGRVLSPLQILMLLQLNGGPKYGYELMKTIQDEFNGVWELKTGTFYPALRRLEAGGFVETSLLDEREFYDLTEKGRKVFLQMGDRLKVEYEFANRYFSTILKWMPTAMKERLFNVIQWMSHQNVNIYSYLPKILDDSLDRDRRLEFLKSLRKLLTTHLEVVESLHKDISEGEEN